MPEPLLIVLIVLAVLIVAFVVVVAMQPSDFRIVRSATMSAPPSTIFAQVNDFHKWQAWSPWAKLDPTMKTTYEGAESGTGAIHTWSGNNQVGEGRMTIMESRPNERIRFKLDFLKPMAATNTAEFTFTPQGKQTLVTWSMSGQNNFIGKAMGLVMNCEKMVGGQFETGLANLKSIVETAKK